MSSMVGGGEPHTLRSNLAFREAERRTPAAAAADPPAKPGKLWAASEAREKADSGNWGPRRQEFSDDEVARDRREYWTVSCARTTCIPLVGSVSSEMTRMTRLPSTDTLLAELEQSRGSLEGSFERRGLRKWDVMWNSSFAELLGQVLTVHDVCDMEGERTLVAHAKLSESYRVERLSETEWRLHAPRGCPHGQDFAFTWRVTDPWCADRWIEQLENACKPPGGDEEVEEAQKDLSLDTVLFMLPMLLNPLLGGSVMLGNMLADLVELMLSTGEADPVDTEADEKHDPHPLVSNAACFSRCLLDGNDVDMRNFCTAVKDFNRVMLLTGRWSMPMVKANLEHVAVMERQGDSAGSEGLAMRSLLRHEWDLGLHSPGACGDPSAAMSCLWGRRGMVLWAECFRACLQAVEDNQHQEHEKFKKCLDHAYSLTFRPYNGFVMLSGYAVLRKFVPEWPSVMKRLAPSEEELREDLEAWLRATDGLLARMRAIQEELDLEDQTKTY